MRKFDAIWLLNIHNSLKLHAENWYISNFKAYTLNVALWTKLGSFITLNHVVEKNVTRFITAASFLLHIESISSIHISL